MIVARITVSLPADQAGVHEHPDPWSTNYRQPALIEIDRPAQRTMMDSQQHFGMTISFK